MQGLGPIEGGAGRIRHSALPPILQRPRMLSIWPYDPSNFSAYLTVSELSLIVQESYPFFPNTRAAGETVAYSLFPRKIHMRYRTFHTSGVRIGEPWLLTREIKADSDVQVEENGVVTLLKPDDQAGFRLKGGSVP